MSREEARRRSADLTKLGRKLFLDPAFSASGKLSCASCHDPGYAFAPANNLAVQIGGKDLNQPGRRSVPSLRYLQSVPQFTEHYFDAERDGDDSIDNGPTGGLTWDGRVDRLRDQARIPLLSPIEMGNENPSAVVRAARKASYSSELRELLGKVSFDSDEKVFDLMLTALEAYQQNPADFYPFSSKYDAWLDGKATLNDRERRGLAIFNDPDKGNCTSCHFGGPNKNGAKPLFTDYGIIALGVPRNPAIPANEDPAYYDLGLCGPDRTDFRDRPEYCGRFRTPTLRNAAIRHVFFHNGAIHSLKEVIEFYVERDTKPDSGAGRKFNDLPVPYADNVNTDPPFGGNPGDKPRLSADEISDLVAFLETLTDGYQPGK